MNKIKHVVTEVVMPPSRERIVDNFDYPTYVWKLKVKANSYGRLETHTLSFDKKSEAEQVSPGYEFMA